MKVGDIVEWKGEPARIMAIAEGYAMCRRKGAIPFVARLKDLDPPNLFPVGARVRVTVADDPFTGEVGTVMAIVARRNPKRTGYTLALDCAPHLSKGIDYSDYELAAAN